MRAVVFHDAGDVRVEDLPDPTGSAGDHEVVFRPTFCGICGSDLHEFQAGPIEMSVEPHPLTGAALPQILGHECGGVVEAVGAQVAKVKPGDRITIQPLIYCGACAFCRAGLQHLCKVLACFGTNWKSGGMAELAVVDEDQVVPLPDAVSDEQAALVEPTAVAINAVRRTGIGVGDAVLVTGGGPIGALCVMTAIAAGAAAIFVSEPNLKRAALAASLGVTKVFDPTLGGVIDQIQEATNGAGVDVSLECSGREEALRLCLVATRARGTVGQVGLQSRGCTVDVRGLTECELTLVGAYGFELPIFALAISEIGAGAIPVEKIVTSRIPLQDTPQAFMTLSQPDSHDVKAVVAAQGV